MDDLNKTQDEVWVPEDEPKRDEFDSKNIYLRKDGQIVGLHAIGIAGPYEFDLVSRDGTSTRMKTDFEELEKWGNEYDEDHNMLGRGSFRVFDLTLEHAAEEYIKDGWERFEGPLK